LNRSMLVTAWTTALLLVACTPASDVVPTTQLPSTSVQIGSTTTIQPAIRTGVGVGDAVIEVGLMVPRSGPLAVFGESVLRGQVAYWDFINEVLGGVGGEFLVELSIVDHGYDTAEAVALFGHLSSSVVGLTGGLGSPIDEALAPLAEESGLLMVSGSLLSEWAGHPAVVPNLLLPTYRDQVAAGLAWAAGEGTTGQTGILYQEGNYGEDCVRGYDRAVSDLGFSNVARVAHSLASTDFGDAVDQLSASEAETVVVCTTPDALVRIIATAESLDFRPTWLVSAASFDQAVPTALGGDAGLDAGLAILDRTWILGAGPPPGSPAAQLLQDVFDGVEETNWYTLLGYGQAATFHLILEEAFEASDLTRSGLREAARRLEGVDLGLDGPLSSLAGLVPVDASAVGAIDQESLLRPFGIPASEPYFPSPFTTP